MGYPRRMGYGGIVGFGQEVWRAARRDHVLHLAGGLAFFAALSLVPLIIILVAVVGHWIGQSEALLAQGVAWFSEVLPAFAAEIRQLFVAVVTGKESFGVMGLVVLFFAASLLFTSLEGAVDRILQTPRPRRLWHSHAVAVGMILLAALLFSLPVLANLTASVWSLTRLQQIVPQLFRGDHFFFLANAVGFLIIVRVAPNQSPRLTHVGVAALLFATCAMIARWIFHAYLQFALDRYHLIYGSLAVLVVGLLWLYYVSVLFLVCVEVVGVWQRRQMTIPARST